MEQLIDRFNRVHNKLRISLTRDENQFCVYWDPSLSLSSQQERYTELSFDNLLKLIRVFVTELGITEIKFTGGEPLDRKNVFRFFKKLSEFNQNYKIDFGITTNGLKLYENIDKLIAYGINKININLNTLNKTKFIKSNPGFDIENVFKAVEKAEQLGLSPLKINCVVMKGFNDDEILDFVDYFKDRDINIRYIEFLPFADKWGVNSYISVDQIYKKITARYSLNKLKTNELDVARNYSIKNHIGTIGFISSLTNHLCSSCNRMRITAEGNIVMCLFSNKNRDLNIKKLLESKKLSDKEIAQFISSTLYQKDLHHPDVEKLLLLNKSKSVIVSE